NVAVENNSKSLPDIPTEEELQRYYQVVWKAKNSQDLLIIKTLLYTGARDTELINMKLSDVDFQRCQIRINSGKGDK
ncbi:tyrosine-type recombinase/integrase, partial [Acinetobacter baumannii]